MTFDLPFPVNAFGLEIFNAGNSDLNDPTKVFPTDISLSTTLGTDLVFDNHNGPNGNELFAGVVSATESFDSVTLIIQKVENGQDTIYLDDLVFGTAPSSNPIPEPTMFLTWAGLICCGTIAAKRGWRTRT